MNRLADLESRVLASVGNIVEPITNRTLRDLGALRVSVEKAQ